jgi:DNA-directed RNA polymerases I, II, and III subunit RPABC2
MADDIPLDEYNQALDAVDYENELPEEPEDIGADAVKTAEAIGITEPPSQKTHYLLDQHPEIVPDYEETVLDRLIMQDAFPPRAANDKRHITAPFLTLYEKTKVLSFRASQLAHGALPFIDIPDYLTDVYEIARLELENKRLPYIIKRPLPDGTYEYWSLADLMLL